MQELFQRNRHSTRHRRHPPGQAAKGFTHRRRTDTVPQELHSHTDFSTSSPQSSRPCRSRACSVRFISRITLAAAGRHAPSTPRFPPPTGGHRSRTCESLWGPLPTAAPSMETSSCRPNWSRDLAAHHARSEPLNPVQLPPRIPMSPIPGLLEGYGHIGLRGTIGWADPATGSSFGYVHNRLLTLMLFDMGSFAGPAPLLSAAIGEASGRPRRGAELRRPVRGLVYRRSRRRRIARRGITRRRIATPYRLPQRHLHRHPGGCLSYPALASVSRVRRTRSR